MIRKNLLSVIILFLYLQTFLMGTPTTQQVFQDIDRIELNFGDLVFANISNLTPMPDGFLILLNESNFGDLFLLAKLSKKGNYICHYDKRGNGPGEMRRISNIVATDKVIYMAESTSPFIHELSHNLEFIKDHRLKVGGKMFLLGNYIGIWGPNHAIDSKKKNYLLTLYDNKTFEYKKKAFSISEIPPYVFSWGGMCRVDNNTFAGVYCNQYKIFLFDNELNLKNKSIPVAPEHVIKYTRWKGDKHTLDQSGVNWMHSWTKMHSIFCVDKKIIVVYIHNKKRFIDIYSLSGDCLVSNFKIKKNRSLSFTQDSFLWWLEWNNDSSEHTLIKTKLNVK